MKFRKGLAAGAALAIILAAAVAAAGASAQTAAASDPTVPDFHIDQSGNIRVTQAKVMLIAGNSFYLRYYVGLAFIRILIKANDATKIYRRYGDVIPLSRITVGDTLNFHGNIESGADTLSVIADSITDLSDQEQISGFSGTITGFGSTTGSFLIDTDQQGVITVDTGTTTQVRKGTRILTPDRVKIGDLITDTMGTFDHAAKTLAANVLTIYTDMSVYKPRNFQGTIKSLAGDGDQRSITFTFAGKDYAVALKTGAEILRANRKPVSLARFVVGDTVRIYGNIREADDPIIDTEIIRDLDL